jgi:anti-sigma B factor antagonist
VQRPHVVRFSGELDLWREAEFERTLGEIAGGPITVDLRDVRYLDSSCLNALVRLRRRLPDAAITIEVATPSSRRIFAITQLDAIFTVVLRAGDAPNGGG